jgi:hypothetical protein
MRVKHFLIAPGDEELSQHQEIGQDGQDGNDFLQETAPGSISQGPEQEWQRQKKKDGSHSVVCKHIFVHSILIYPHETITGMDFSGEMVMASTGQYMRHRWQIWQSAG